MAEVSYDTQNPELILPESYTREELEEILLWLTKEQAERIMDKYGNSFRKLSENESRKEYKEVLMFVANESNCFQRKLVGLDK